MPTETLAFLASQALPGSGSICVSGVGSGEDQAVIATVKSTAEGSQSFYSGSCKIPPLRVPHFLPRPPRIWV